MAKAWRGFRRVARWRNLGVAVALLMAAILVWSTLTTNGRTTVKSLLFLPNLIPDFPVRPINWVTRTPDRIEVTFSDGVTTWSGDLYLPATAAPHPGIIVALGVTPAGRDDRPSRGSPDGSLTTARANYGGPRRTPNSRKDSNADSNARRTAADAEGL